MFSIVVISVLIILIIHYAIDIFTAVPDPVVDLRVQKYKTIIEQSNAQVDEEEELLKYAKSI